jgi:Protein of unknown function (DUF 659)/hAT family C-terminal dimerisation region
MLYAVGVFASGGHYGLLTEDPAWEDFWAAIFGSNPGSWRPPSRYLMANKYLDVVHNNVVSQVDTFLSGCSGGCLQFDSWTDPAGGQVFTVLFGAPLPFFVKAFRINGLRESSDTLVAKISAIVDDLTQGGGDTAQQWQDQRMVAVVTDSPNVMRKARSEFLSKCLFAFAYGCAAHAMSNLVKNLLTVEDASKGLAFAMSLAKFFGGRHLPRAHLQTQAAAEIPRPRTLKMFSRTRWTGSSSAMDCALENENAVQVVVMKAKRGTIDMDLPSELYQSVIDDDNWRRLKVWAPILREIAAVTMYLEADTTPLSGVHLSFLYLERVFKDASGVDAATKTRILAYLKMRYATIYSAVHILAFYLDPALVKVRQASRMSVVKPYTTSDASVCIAAGKALLNHGQASEAHCAAVEDQIVSVCTSAAPYLSPLAVADNASFRLPHVWWEIMTDTAPIAIKRVAALVFSCAATSASGERSFKARSRVHTRTRNRLSNDGADKSQAILFNRKQSHRAADGVLLVKRTNGMELRMVAALLNEGPVPPTSAEAHVPNADDDVGDDDGDIVGSGPAGGEDVELGALVNGTEDGLTALEEVLAGLIAEEGGGDDAC